jgi:hypothetical protein
VSEALRLTPERERALKELAGLAVRMKEAGLLGWLKAFTENADKLIALAAADDALARSLGLAHAVSEGITRPEVHEIIKAKDSIKELSTCTIKALAMLDASNVRPVGGVLGLLKALGDEDVKEGLGALIALAKGLGACLRGRSRTPRMCNYVSAAAHLDYGEGIRGKWSRLTEEAEGLRKSRVNQIG